MNQRQFENEMRIIRLHNLGNAVGIAVILIGALAIMMPVLHSLGQAVSHLAERIATLPH
jgi:hypothetical protein